MATETRSKADRLKDGQAKLAEMDAQFNRGLDLWVSLEAQWRAEEGNADKCPVGGCPPGAIVRCQRCALEATAGIEVRET